MAALWSMAFTRFRACLLNFAVLLGLASALASFASAAPTLLSMNEPSFGSSPSGQSTLAFSRPRQSRAVTQPGMVVLVVVVGTGAVVVVVVVAGGGLATSAKGDSEFTVRQA